MELTIPFELRPISTSALPFLPSRLAGRLLHTPSEPSPFPTTGRRAVSGVAATATLRPTPAPTRAPTVDATVVSSAIPAQERVSPLRALLSGL
jgi:hypothetical protein